MNKGKTQKTTEESIKRLSQMGQVIFTAWCHHEQTAALLLKFRLGHVLQYTSFFLNFSALHLITLTQLKRGRRNLQFNILS